MTCDLLAAMTMTVKPHQRMSRFFAARASSRAPTNRSRRCRSISTLQVDLRRCRVCPALASEPGAAPANAFWANSLPSWSDSAFAVSLSARIPLSRARIWEKIIHVTFETLLVISLNESSRRKGALKWTNFKRKDLLISFSKQREAFLKSYRNAEAKLWNKWCNCYACRGFKGPQCYLLCSPNFKTRLRILSSCAQHLVRACLVFPGMDALERGRSTNSWLPLELETRRKIGT